MAQSPRLLAGPLPSYVPFSKFQSLSVLQGPHLQMGQRQQVCGSRFQAPCTSGLCDPRAHGDIGPLVSKSFICQSGKEAPSVALVLGRSPLWAAFSAVPSWEGKEQGCALDG